MFSHYRLASLLRLSAPSFLSNSPRVIVFSSRFATGFTGAFGIGLGLRGVGVFAFVGRTLVRAIVTYLNASTMPVLGMFLNSK